MEESKEERINVLARTLLKHGAVKTEAEALERARTIVTELHEGTSPASVEGLADLQSSLSELKEHETRDGLNADEIGEQIASLEKELEMYVKELQDVRARLDKTENALSRAEKVLRKDGNVADKEQR